MLFSKSFIPTLRESPAEAEIISHQLMLRAGLIRKVAAGIYEWLPAGLRVLKNVEKIVRAEMNAVDGQEVWLPMLQPKELWQETGRWNVYGRELMRLKDRKDAEFCLAPTAEEVITDLVRREVRSYRALPLMLYQFGVKYRDEIRPRFGVMRAREFYMKDAYSFHTDEADAERHYRNVYDAYARIFKRCGLKYRPVEADSGAIGGSYSHEFMVLAETGEEGIVSSPCGYAANVERAEIKRLPVHTEFTSSAIQEVDTPGVSSVEAVATLLQLPAQEFIKLLVLMADDQPIVVLMRGDHELNEVKLKNYLNVQRVVKANEATYTQVTGSPVGFAGPVGLQVKIIADHAVQSISDGVAGANKKDKHLIHVVPGRDFKAHDFADLRKATGGDPCPKCDKPLEYARGIEVGHTFKLGTKYSTSLKATYLDPQGKPQLIVMGCYGIGISRIVAACIEQCHDKDGIVWPRALAPWAVDVIALNISHSGVSETAKEIYAELSRLNIEVLFDDRDLPAGVKLKDADLLGIPVRVVIGERKLAEGKVEWKSRNSAVSEDLPVSQLSARMQQVLADQV